MPNVDQQTEFLTNIQKKKQDTGDGDVEHRYRRTAKTKKDKIYKEQS